MLLACAGAVALAQTEPQLKPKEREKAARELGKGGAAGIPRLHSMLKDPVTDVRIEVVKSLVAIGTQLSLDPLIEATRDNDPEVQIRATDGLVNFYLPGYVRTGISASLRRAGGAIKARFTDTSGQTIDPWVRVRPEVVEALGKLARGGSNMDSRANAARAVGVLRGQAALDDLCEALRSKNDQVMYECLIAIQKIRDPSAASCIAYLLRDLNDKIQIAAIETTGLLRNREALPNLRAALDSARNTKIRCAALGALAMIPDEESRPLYTRYLADRDEGMRAAAAEGLARLKNPSDIPTLEKAFSGERKMPARLAQAFALVTLGKNQTAEFSPLQYLVNTLNSVAWRGVARAYLIEAGRETVVRRSLESAAAAGSKDEKIELARILAVSGDKGSVPTLETLSRNPDTDVAGAALDAMRTLKARLP